MNALLKGKLSRERLLEALHYNPDSGAFTWKISPVNHTKVGANAGTLVNHGYFRIQIDKTLFLSHQLAYFYMTGEVHKYIDHINGNPKDNRFSNLRPATHSQNLMNRTAPPNNTSGVKGVSQDRRDKKWRAYLTVNRKRINLGSFSTKDDARVAVEQARKIYHGEFCNNEVRHGS